MKIAIYYDVPAGGAFRTMEEEIKLLRLKHEIVVYHNLKPIFTPPILTRFFKDCESIIFQRFRQRAQAAEIDRQKFDVVYVSHDRHSQAPWILRFLKTPTVFLCQEPTRAYFEEFLKIDPHLPLTNRIYESINRYLRKNIEIHNASFAKAIVANSVYSTESIFRAYGLKSTPVYLGIDREEYFPESLSKRNQIFIIGNHEPQKALPFAIEVFSKIDKRIRPRLVIGSPRDGDHSELKSLAKKLGVDLEIKVGLHPGELRNIYSRSKITLAVAYLEPFGLSVIESLACGTPVVAVREGGFKETIVNGKTGLLVPRDAAKIAGEIQSLLTHKLKREEMGRAGVKEVRGRFTWKNTVDQLEKIFYENSRRHR